MASIYVASSWRHPYYPEVVKRLRAEGHEVYDFRNPPHGGNGFRWTDRRAFAGGIDQSQLLPDAARPELSKVIFTYDKQD